MDINLERVLSRLEELYQCGAQDDGTYTRMAYSPGDIKGRETFAGYVRKLGLEPVISFWQRTSRKRRHVRGRASYQ